MWLTGRWGQDGDRGAAVWEQPSPLPGTCRASCPVWPPLATSGHTPCKQEVRSWRGRGGCGVWGLDNSDLLKPHKPQAAWAGEGAWRGQLGRPLGFLLRLRGSVLTDGTGGPEQECGAPASPSLGPQLPPLTPHFSLWPEGAFGRCAGCWGRHGARGQANRASGKGMQTGGDLHEQLSGS